MDSAHRLPPPSPTSSVVTPHRPAALARCPLVSTASGDKQGQRHEVGNGWSGGKSKSWRPLGVFFLDSRSLVFTQSQGMKTVGCYHRTAEPISLKIQTICSILFTLVAEFHRPTANLQI